MVLVFFLIHHLTLWQRCHDFVPVVFEDIIVVLAELVPNFLYFPIGFYGFKDGCKLRDKSSRAACVLVRFSEWICFYITVNREPWQELIMS